MDLIDQETMQMAKEYDEEHANDPRNLEFYDKPEESQENEDENGQDDTSGDEKANVAKDNNGDDASGDDDKTDDDEKDDAEDSSDEGITIADLVPKDEPEEQEEEPDTLSIKPVVVNGVDMTERLSQELETKTGEERYLYARISPAVITGEGGKQILVYGPESIPKDFKFIDEADMTRAQNEFARIGREAKYYHDEYQEKQTKSKEQEFAQQKAESDLSDIAEMQEEGLIPRFNKSASLDDLNDDPVAELVDTILGLEEDMNRAYKENGSQRVVGFKEAYNEFMRINPDVKEAIKKDREGTKDTDTELEEEDNERMQIARRTNSSKSISSSSNGTDTKKLKEPSGLRTVQDWADWAQTVNPNEI